MATHYTYGVTHFYSSILFLCFGRCCCSRFTFHILGSHILFGSHSLLRRKLNRHPLAFQYRHLVYLGIILQIVGKAQQQNFALFFEQNGAPFKEHISPYLIAIFQKAFGMLQLGPGCNRFSEDLEVLTELKSKLEIECVKRKGKQDSFRKRRYCYCQTWSTLSKAGTLHNTSPWLSHTSCS